MPGIDAKSDAIYELVEEGSGVEQLATGFTFTEGPIWHPTEHHLLFSDMPGDVRRKYTPDGTVVGGAAAVVQVQRHDLRRRPQPARLRARLELARPRAPGRRARDARLPLAGQVPEQPQRRLRPLGRVDLLLGPVVRALPRLRHPARARARLAGRLPHPAGRRPGRARARARRGRVRHAERPLLLARRVAALHQRHAARPHQGVGRQRGRLALERPDVLRRRRHGRDRGGHPRRDEVRRAREHLGHRPRRRLGDLRRAASTSARSRCPRTSATSPGAAPTGTRSTSRRRRRCTRSARSSAPAASHT